MRSRSGALDAWPRMAAKSELEERQMLLQLTAVERMHTMIRCPTMLVSAWEREGMRYVDRNARVLDPVVDIEAEACIRVWTADEKRMFMDKFLQFPKVGCWTGGFDWSCVGGYPTYPLLLMILWRLLVGSCVYT